MAALYSLHLRLCKGNAYDYIVRVSLYRTHKGCARIDVLSIGSCVCGVVRTSISLGQSSFSRGDIYTIVNVNGIVSVNYSNCYGVISSEFVNGLDNLFTITGNSVVDLLTRLIVL